MKRNKPASCLLLHQTHEHIRSNSALSTGTLPQLGPLGRTSQHKNIQVFALKSSLSIEREDNIRNRKQLGRPKKEGKNRGMLSLYIERSHRERAFSASDSRVEENASLTSGVGGQNGQTGWRLQRGNSGPNHTTDPTTCPTAATL